MQTAVFFATSSKKDHLTFDITPGRFPLFVYCGAAIHTATNRWATTYLNSFRAEEFTHRLKVKPKFTGYPDNTFTIDKMHVPQHSEGKFYGHWHWVIPA
jgi:hypothetical protein